MTGTSFLYPLLSRPEGSLYAWLRCGYRTARTDQGWRLC